MLASPEAGEYAESMSDGTQPHEEPYFQELLDEALEVVADPHIEPEWWFNIKTGQVEDGPQSLGIDRIGPFKTREEALRANDIVAECARQWAEEES